VPVPLTLSTPPHTESESNPWTIELPDHPERSDSAGFRASKSLAKKILAALDVSAEFYGSHSLQMHHGGSLWLYDGTEWFMVQNEAGIEWSAQFCADPVKVDQLRVNARRLYAAFPDAVSELGIRQLLDTPITDAAGVAEWTDSVCNASLPLPRAFHQGIVPHDKTGGLHHYPAPIVEIALFKRDDFNLWVNDDGVEVAVVPVAARGSGDGRTRVLYSARLEQPEDSPMVALRGGIGVAEVGEPGEDPTILPADHPVSVSAFAEQHP
jgi:Family of unknown function (DUF6424)